MTADTTHIVVGWNADYEQAYTHVANEGEAEETHDVYEVDVPTNLWDALVLAREAYTLAEERVLAAAGFDAEAGRMAACCAKWEGHEMPGHTYFGVYLAGSGNDHEWPIGDTHYMVTSEQDQEMAERFVATLPEEFYLSAGHQMVRVRRDRFHVASAELTGSVSACYHCGWERRDHPGGA